MHILTFYVKTRRFFWGFKYFSIATNTFRFRLAFSTIQSFFQDKKKQEQDALVPALPKFIS